MKNVEINLVRFELKKLEFVLDFSIKNVLDSIEFNNFSIRELRVPFNFPRSSQSCHPNSLNKKNLVLYKFPHYNFVLDFVPNFILILIFIIIESPLQIKLNNSPSLFVISSLSFFIIIKKIFRSEIKKIV
jgi:hypothetical protein